MTDTPGQPNELEDRIDRLERENEQLRERLAALEAEAAGETDAELREQTSTQSTREATRELLTSGGQPTKVIARLSDTDGIGVLGEATGDGATTGVRGETQSSSDGASGVSGVATAGSGRAYGVYADSNSADAPSLFVTGATSGDAVEAAGRILTNSDIDLDKDDDDDFKEIRMSDSGKFFYNPDFNGNALIGPADADTFWVGTGTDVRMFGGRVRFDDMSEQRTAGPIAKGHVSADASSFVNAVNVDSVSWNSTATRYEIEINGIQYDDVEYATIVTPSHDPVVAETGQIWGDPDKLTIEFADDSQHDFQFVIYDLPDGTATASESTTKSVDSDAPSSG